LVAALFRKFTVEQLMQDTLLIWKVVEEPAPQLATPEAFSVSTAEPLLFPANICHAEPVQMQTEPAVDGVHPVKFAAVPVVFWFHVGAPVAFVRTNTLGVPRSGVMKRGELVSATLPEPDTL